MDITKPEEVKDQKVLVSGADSFYVSTENIYVTNENYNSGRDTVVTEIAKFHYKDGRITGVAAGSATITVKTVDGAKTATCAVTITE